jgi:hypothetical protein
METRESRSEYGFHRFQDCLMLRQNEAFSSSVSFLPRRTLSWSGVLLQIRRHSKRLDGCARYTHSPYLDNTALLYFPDHPHRHRRISDTFFKPHFIGSQSELASLRKFSSWQIRCFRHVSTLQHQCQRSIRRPFAWFLAGKLLRPYSIHSMAYHANIIINQVVPAWPRAASDSATVRCRA